MAKDRAEPLLYKSDDFAQADIIAARNDMRPYSGT